MMSTDSASAQSGEVDNQVFTGDLEEVLQQIEEVHPVKFFYNDQDLPDESVEVFLSGQPIPEVINIALERFDLRAFAYNQYVIIIGKRELIEENLSSDLYATVAISGQELFSSVKMRKPSNRIRSGQSPKIYTR